MSNKKDYTSSSLTITVLVIVFLLCISRIPSLTLGGIKLKNVNIISDIISGEEGKSLPSGDAYFDSTFLAEAVEAEVEATVPDPVYDSTAYLNIPATRSEHWNLYPQINLDSLQTHGATLPVIDTTHMVFIEEYGENGKQMSRFYSRFLNKKRDRPTRIAVFGDSFIEGDIITADLREEFQTIYGGRGVGFVPFDSPYSKSRGTINQTSTGWHTFSIANYSSVPDSIKHKFFASGFISIPEDGATTTIRGVDFRKHIQQTSTAKLLFTNHGHSSIHVTVNDTLSRTFTPVSSPYPQELSIAVGPINSISTTIYNAAGFIGYGMIMQDSIGVSVDNYSMRGNSGLALLATNTTINSQISRMIGYDLVILQYGLNVMSADVVEYNSYSKKLENIISYISKCFPNSSILVMGIGDRSTKIDGEFMTMPSIRGMINAQRKAAANSEVAFWNTYEAMGGYNSMIRFVDNKWAAKDYTHITYPGGQYIAKQLVRSLVRDIIQYDNRKKREKFTISATKPQ